MEENFEKEADDGYYFETFAMGLKVPKKENPKEFDTFFFGHLVVDFFECPECGWHHYYHHYVDESEMKTASDAIKKLGNPSPKGYDVYIMFPYNEGTFCMTIGKYVVSDEGYNFKVDWDEPLFEKQQEMMDDLFRFREEGVEFSEEDFKD